MARAGPIPGLEPSTDFGEAARRAVAVRAQELWDQAEGVLDTDDIERVHDMRVATRRLRAVLEIFAPCFASSEHRGVLRDVKSLADALGARRDPDVQIAALRAYREQAPTADRPGVGTLIASRQQAQVTANVALSETLAEVVRSDLRGRLAALVEANES